MRTWMVWVAVATTFGCGTSSDQQGAPFHDAGDPGDVPAGDDLAASDDVAAACDVGVPPDIGASYDSEPSPFDQGTGEAVDCAWMAGIACWAVVLEAAQACLPSPDDMGIFSADYSSCSYDDGHAVAFTPPPADPWQDVTTWSFTVSSNGRACLHYESTRDAVNGYASITVGTDTVSTRHLGAGLDANAALNTLTCPDGTTYTATVAEAYACPGGLNRAPNEHVGKSVRPGGISLIDFALGKTSSGTELDVFRCRKP